MTPLRVVAVGRTERALLEAARDALACEFDAPCTIASPAIDPAFAYHPERNQHHSTMLLDLIARQTSGDEILIGVADVDLFIPILTFVFGEAQMGGRAAVISSHRLQQEFYGLPADAALLRERVAKEAVHEAGHVFRLTHCDDYQCVMAASYSVEWLDLKGRELCAGCRATVG